MAESRNLNKISAQDAFLNIDHGKMPPQAIDLEEAVLGALMMEKDSIEQVMDILVPESFYKAAHQKIYKAIVDLSMNLQPIDILTVTDALRKKGELDEVGGPFYITQLTTQIASAAHVEYHGRIVAQKHIQRELIRVSSEIQRKAFDDSIDVNDLIDYSESSLFQVSEGNIKNQTTKIDSIIRAAIGEIEEAAKSPDGLNGVPSGFTGIDRITSGWKPGNLIIIAARPAMGKTAFTLSMARNIAVDFKKPIAFFSLEMSSVELVTRLIISETGLPGEKIKRGRLEQYEWVLLEEKIKNLEAAPMFIDDTPGISIFELRAKARRLKKQFDIQCIFIDYLQLMTGPVESRGNREQEVSAISRSLKAIAKELGLPIVTLSQLNRSVETRGGNKRPQLSDLRESGAIEQDADMVMFIHRPEYYGITVDEDQNSTVGMAEIIISKHRSGAVGDVKLRFKKELAKFVDFEDTDLANFSGGDDNGSEIILQSSMNKHEHGSTVTNPDENAFDPSKDFDGGNAPF